MRVAVLMSTYNGEKYLRTQIDSILNQSGDFSVDVIIRDDGSSDNTKKILDMYQRNGQIRWYTGENLKSAKSFMDLIFYAGEYDFYCFCDQDDYWKPEKIQHGLEQLLNEKGPCIYYCNAELVDKDLKPLGSVLYKRAPHTDLYTVSCGTNVIGCTMILNKESVNFVKKHGVPEIVSMHDAFLARTCLAIGGKIIFKNYKDILYRQHGKNVLGVETNTWKKIKARVHGVLTEAPVRIDEQSMQILNLYGEEMPDKNKKWLRQVAGYRKNFFSRIQLATTRKTRYISYNMSVKIRLQILLGNR